MPSRRVLLRTVGASVLATIAGCSGTSQSNPETPTETASESTTTEYQETTIMSPVSTTAAASETTTASRTTSATETTASTETATTDEEQETAQGTTETTEDEPNSQSFPSNGGSGNPSGGGSSNGSGTTESTTTEPTTAETTTSTRQPGTTETTTEQPPTATTTETTATTQPPTATTTEPTTETSTTEPTTTEEPPTTTTETTTTTEQPPSEGGSWSNGPDFPAPQSNMGGGVVDGSIYCFGGIESGENLPAVARTYRFDPADGGEGTWHRLGDMPRALWAPCGVAAEGNLYSFGGAPTDAPYGTGEPPSDEIFVYAPDEGWRNLTAETGVRCPYPNWAMGGVYDPGDGLIYLVGGGTDVTDRESASDHGVGTDDPGTYDESRVWTFDPATEEVANPDLVRLPKARRWPSVARTEVGGETYIHAICGLFGVTGPTNDNLRYRVSTGEWESMTPAPRSGCYATNSNPVIDGTLFLTHGFFWEDEPSVDSYEAACHAYDPATDSFRTDLPSPQRLRGGAVDAVVEDTLHVVGGHVKRYDQNGYHDCKTATEAFTPSK